jgi:ribosomal 50S subunit-recycling heat shock protein
MKQRYGCLKSKSELRAVSEEMRDLFMRIDKYLKLSRLIKRRTLANEACETGHVTINGKTAKPGTEVKVGDIVEIRFGNSLTKVEVASIAEHVTKEGSKEMYVIL